MRLALENAVSAASLLLLTEAALTDRTGLVVGSAPCYPYGVIDPIEQLAAMAGERDILFHTDACLGGWLLPWWERLGIEIPPWDFRVPGVTSISADIHKYGYTFKGASIVLYRSRELLQHQFFWYDDWPGGLYASGTTAGTRSAAPIAGAWAAINHLGVDGYLRLAQIVRDTSERFQAGINAIEGLRVTFSLGVVACRPADTAASLLERADAALYRAKDEGRDRLQAG